MLLCTPKHHHAAALPGWCWRTISPTGRRLPPPPRRRRLFSSHDQPFPPIPSSTSGYAKLPSDPLRILFCGSDAFSVASLRALHALRAADPSLVESLDVLVRPGKPVGRGLKHIARGPCYHVARDELGLPVHERDTFTSWDLPTTHQSSPGPAFNLIIAVSFGLFVPPRIINAVKYGGLNLHPSLLPDLAGPAPLQWTILANRPVTGVTLQTLHPAAYDRGVVLAQTPAPGIPVPDDATAGSLLATLADEGAKLLVDGLTRQLHVPPYQDCPRWWLPPAAASTNKTARIVLRDAPKLTTHQSHLDWRCRFWGADKTLYPEGRLSASDISRAYRALVWDPPPPQQQQQQPPPPQRQDDRKADGIRTHALLNAATAQRLKSPAGDQTKRVILTDLEPVPCPPVLRNMVEIIAKVRRSELLLSILEEYEDDYQGESLEYYQYPDEDDEDRYAAHFPPGFNHALAQRLSIQQDALDEAKSIWKDPTRDLSCVRSISWTMPDDGQSNNTHEVVRLPVLVDDKSGTVTMPIGVPYCNRDGKIPTAAADDGRPLDALRINFAKVEGGNTKPAAQALRRFIDLPLSLEQVQENEYAIDVMTRTVD